MKRFFFLIFIFLDFFSIALSQEPIKISNPKREIRFVDLSVVENQSYFRRNRELTKLVLEAIDAGALSTYYIDYEKDYKEVSLSTEQFVEKITIKGKGIDYNGEEYETTYRFFPSNLYLIGFDQTYGKLNGNEYNLIIPAQTEPLIPE